MEHLCHEAHAWRLSWVLLSKLELKFKEASVPGGAFGSFDEGSPVVEVAFFGRGVDAFVLLVAEFLQIPDEALFGRIAHSY